jgi:hypothetical protein
VNITCIKCKYILDIEQHPDTGECPFCQGMMYQDGDIIEEGSKRAIDLMSEVMAKYRAFGPPKKPPN